MEINKLAHIATVTISMSQIIDNLENHIESYKYLVEQGIIQSSTYNKLVESIENITDVVREEMNK